MAYSSIEEKESRALNSISALHSPVGLIAGNGSFPLEFAKNAKEQGLDVVAVAHIGETDPVLEKLVSKCLWIKVGQLGKTIRFLKKGKVKQVAFVGGIKRVNLFGGVKLDLRGTLLLTRLRSVKDDALLRGVAGEIESSGIEVISANSLLKESVPKMGVLTKRALSDKERKDADIGWEAAKGLGALDIGQTVIVSEGVVVAVEAIEGTDATILRAGNLSKSGVVVKVPKPQQDLRMDVPAVGVTTIDNMKAAGLTALVLESGKAWLNDPQEIVAAADSAGIAIEAFDGGIK